EEEGMSPENSGRAHVFSGVNGSLLFTLVSPNEEHGGDFGYSVSGAGDINNDGYADVIAGARNEDPGTSLLSVGRAYVFSGNGGSLLFTISAPNEEHGASVGWSVSDIGDINGDGTLDVVVGEFGNTPDLTGRAYVLSESTPLKIVGAEGWRMLTTPVVNATFDDLLGSLWTQGFPGSDYDGSSPVAAPNVYRYDETVAGDADAGFTPPVNQGEQVGSGVGFIAYVFSDDDFDGTPEGFPKRISVTGASPTGSVNLPVTYTDNGPTDQDEGWQLYGNPFAERVDSDAFVTSGFDSAVYVWDPAQAAYRVWDGSAGDLTDGVIAPFQGFFARAQSGAAAFEIPQGARTIGGAFYGRVRGETPTLALTLETTHGEARAWVRVRDTASMTYGRFDAYALGPLAPSYVQLYTRPPGTTEGTPAAGLVINALPPLTDGERYSVPLDLRIVEDGQQVQSRSTLRWPSLQAIPHNWTLELVDTETDTIVDLRKTDAYTFDWTPSPLAGESQAAHEARALLPRPMVVRGVAANRFELLITASTGVGTTTEDVGRPDVVTLSPNYPNPFSASTTLEFGLPEAGPVRLVVHDVLGRHVATLINEERRAGWHHLRLNGRALASGVYVVHLKFKDQATSIRMLVAY
ncbi:MAG: FG-GAP-like repeat-containing protein, partial [Bacteroidota bacterium]